MKIICVGRNYSEHIKELNNSSNENPVIFLKPETAVITGKLPFFIPDFSNEIHHEVEIVIRINKTGKNIEERFANRYYDDVTVGIDFTARDLQTELKSKGLPWELAKSFDGSAPFGSFIGKSEAFQNGAISFSLKKNGETVQSGNTTDMLFSIDFIISFVSRFITLKKGDLIFTGTPKGVAAVKKGDTLEGFIGDKKLIDLKVR
ncbi:MAG: fumarylacetoacetate hydrolase family protein [Bacteroidota bacterium]|jgi:acylpyruvate hydrolase